MTRDVGAVTTPRWREWLTIYVRFVNAICSFLVAGYIAWRFWPW